MSNIYQFKYKPPLIEHKNTSICNLGRLPMQMSDNPLYRTCLQLLENPNIKDKDTFLYQFKYDMGRGGVDEQIFLGDIWGTHFDSLNAPHDYMFLPWIHHRPVSKYKDNAFTNFSASKKINKLKKLLDSIMRYGYDVVKFPDRKGGITGYFLSARNEKRLYIVGGNHRAAVLSALNKDIVFSFESDLSLKPRDREGVGIDLNKFPSTFYEKDAGEWPSVKSGFLTRSQAIEILNRYFYCE